MESSLQATFRTRTPQVVSRDANRRGVSSYPSVVANPAAMLASRDPHPGTNK
jgi:hypothetical protein